MTKKISFFIYIYTQSKYLIKLLVVLSPVYRTCSTTAKRYTYVTSKRRELRSSLHNDNNRIAYEKVHVNTRNECTKIHVHVILMMDYCSGLTKINSFIQYIIYAV